MNTQEKNPKLNTPAIHPVDEHNFISFASTMRATPSALLESAKTNNTKADRQSTIHLNIRILRTISYQSACFLGRNRMCILASWYLLVYNFTQLYYKVILTWFIISFPPKVFIWLTADIAAHHRCLTCFIVNITFARIVLNEFAILAYHMSAVPTTAKNGNFPFRINDNFPNVEGFPVRQSN